MLDKHVLKNGMVILAEPMETVESAAFGFLLPAGASRLPNGCCGASNIISDWIFRGAADMDSRKLSDALDSLGLHRSSSVGTSFLGIGSALEAENLKAALELYAKVINQCTLDGEQFAPAKQLALAGVMSLDDDPRQKVMLKLRENFYPQPLGQSTAGHLDELNDLTADKTKQLAKEYFNLSGTIFSMAGKYDFDSVCRQLEKLFDIESQGSRPDVLPGEAGQKYTHIHSDGAQVHIGLMTKTVKPADDQYYNARMAVSVLSGGMSGRLFTEVREKRGLCYAVGARYHGLKETAGIACYAGTTPDTSQQTVDVILEQFDKLGAEVSGDEIKRAKAGLKSALIMGSESSASRASAIASDYHLLGRVRSLEEIEEKIEKTTAESVTEFLNANKLKDYTVVTIGPKRIKV